MPGEGSQFVLSRQPLNIRMWPNSCRQVLMASLLLSGIGAVRVSGSGSNQEDQLPVPVSGVIPKAMRASSASALGSTPLMISAATP